MGSPDDFQGEDPQQFESLLDSLYYTGIFMAGEWAVSRPRCLVITDPYATGCGLYPFGCLGVRIHCMDRSGPLLYTDR